MSCAGAALDDLGILQTFDISATNQVSAIDSVWTILQGSRAAQLVQLGKLR